MRPWLRGDLEGVDPRAELDALRGVIATAAHRGEDLTRLFTALAGRDPIACAELIAGPRAVAHRRAVEDALVAVAAVEGVLAPSGLYFRLADLAPEAGPRLLETAARRHPGADWVARLSQRFDPLPGRVHLRVAGDGYAAACGVCARAGQIAALTASAVETGSPHPAVALYRADDLPGCLEVAARTLEAHPRAPLIPWLAAVHGPDIDDLIAGLQARRSS